jgi:hypothetical protein
MSFARHPDFRLQRLSIGREAAPLLVIDQLLSTPDELVDLAAGKVFADVASYYPGVRAKVPLTFQRFILESLGDEIAQFFGLRPGALRFTACHFSLVTTPPQQLTYLQRIPHIDSLNGSELALILYLFKAPLGGTAFYRQKKTGFEYVDESRKEEYWRHVQAEQKAVEASPAGYITGDTDFYERTGHQDGVFNRMLVYRRTTLHSGAVAADYAPSLDPRRGRLSVNGFIA